MQGQDLKVFDLSDAINQTTKQTSISKDTVETIVKEFLQVMEDAIAKRGSIHFMNHFSVRLKKRKPRSGSLNGTAWKTPERVDPVFEPSAKLKEIISVSQGIPCA